MPSVVEGTVALGSRIGRYFSLVSMLPALFLVLWSAALAAAGAWTGAPDLALFADRFGRLDLVAFGWILLASLATGLFVHPLQFGMTQLLEGYWGNHPLARTLARLRVESYRARRTTAVRMRNAVQRQLTTEVQALLIAQGDDTLEGDQRTKAQIRLDLLNSERGAHLVGLLTAEAAFDHIARGFPDPSRIMPTRLGNALRREEDRAGRQYGIEAIRTAPHFSLVAPERHVGYVDDTRQQLDTSVRLCVVSLLAATETFACLATDGWWLLIALIPYALAYLAYRASIAAADEYTTAVRTIIDLDRFALYESLNVELPRNSDEERKNNEKLMRLLAGEHVDLRYREPDADSTPPGSP